MSKSLKYLVQHAPGLLYKACMAEGLSVRSVSRSPKVGSECYLNPEVGYEDRVRVPWIAFLVTEGDEKELRYMVRRLWVEERKYK